MLIALSLGQSSGFAQGDRGGRDESRREWRPGGPDGGGRWEERSNRGRGDRRSGWNPEEFLRGLDANGDGKLDPSEMSGRTERYLSELGFDTSKAIQLDAVVEKVRLGRGQSSEKTTKENAVRRVPGFGATTEKVPGFSSNADEQDISEFGEEIVRQVDWVMENYDKNKNGVLEQSEQVEIPAGTPPLQESDTNRDGKLSRLELANRYRARAQYARRNEGESRNSRGNSSRSDGGSGRAAGDRGRFAAEPGSISSGSRFSPRSPSRNASTSADRTQKDRPVDASQIERTARYVENIIEKYDTDQDGKLSAAEIKESGMRNPPKPDAEGFVTKDAYVEFLTKKPQASSSTARSDSNPESQGFSSSRGATRGDPDVAQKDRGSSSTSPRTNDSREKTSSKVTFDDYDEDGNGMIEMHEFSQEWDDEKLEQFYQKDKNRDGVITAKEWKGF